AKFIVMLRNPVDLAYSWHGECLYLGRESEKSFEKAWMLQEIRRQGKRIPLSCSNPSMLFYRDQALLGKAMENILALAGKDKVHWIFMDDLRSDPSGCYRETLRFLEVDDDGRI